MFSFSRGRAAWILENGGELSPSCFAARCLLLHTLAVAYCLPNANALSLFREDTFYEQIRKGENWVAA